MQEITAQLNSYRQSPRKVRLVANAIKGKKVAEAKRQLNFTTKSAVGPLGKLLDSAVANAKNLGLNESGLFIKSITVDGGRILYRRRLVSRGTAHQIRKRTSHIKVVLAEQKPQIPNSKPQTKKV